MMHPPTAALHGGFSLLTRRLVNELRDNKQVRRGRAISMGKFVLGGGLEETVEMLHRCWFFDYRPRSNSVERGT